MRTMKNIWKKYWPYIVMLGLWVLVAVLACSCDRSLKKENEKLRQELAHAQQYTPLQRDTIRDTVEMITQKIVEVERVKEALTKEDKQLLKDMDAKIQAIESFQKIGTETAAKVVLSRDTVAANSTDASKGRSDSKSGADSLLTFKDAWLDLKYNPVDSFLLIQLHDSLALAVEKEYKRKFLLWKWGTKGYKVKAVSFCPYTTIRYNTYVRKRR